MPTPQPSPSSWADRILFAAIILAAVYFMATGEPCGSGCF